MKSLDLSLQRFGLKIDPTKSDTLIASQRGRQFENHSKRLIELVLRPLGIPQQNLQHILRMVEILEMIIQDSQGRYLIPTHLPSGEGSN